MNKRFYLLLTLIFFLFNCRTELYAQDTSQTAPEFLVGAFIASMHIEYAPLTLHEKYWQILDCGFNSVFQKARRPIAINDSTNLDSLSQFSYIYTSNDSGTGGIGYPYNVFNAKIDDYIDWISYFTQAKYTKWEAEGNEEIFNGNVKIKHDDNNTFGYEYTEGNVTGWASGNSISDTGKFLIMGPDYWQWPRYTYTNGGWNNNPITYKAVFRMKIGLPSEVTLPVCQIMVTNTDSDGLETILEPGIITLTTDTLTTEYQDFVIPYDYIGYFDLPPDGSSYPPEPTSVSNPFDEIESSPGYNAGSKVQFKVKWLGNRELFVDYIEVYDERLWEGYFANEIMYDTLVSKIFTYDQNFKNANINFYNKLKYYGTIDEPHVIDCYEPLRKVQSILDLLNTNADLLVHWYPGWDHQRDGDNTWPVYNHLAQPKKIMFWYSPFTQDDDGVPYPRDFTLYYLHKNLQQAHIQQPGFYITLQTWGTKNRYTGIYYNYMHPTSSEVGAGTMLSLAHGIQGIFYEVYYSYYSSDPKLVEGLVDIPENGFTKDTLWYKAQELASRLKGTLGNTLMALDYTGYYLMLRKYVHQSSDNGNFQDDWLALSSISEKTPPPLNFHAGILENQDQLDNNYFLLTNQITDGSRLVDIGVKPPVDGYNNYRFRNIEPEYNFDRTFKDSLSVDYEFPAGEGYLFQVAPVVIYGGNLMYDETITSELSLLDDMIISEAVTLTIDDIYHINADVTVYGNITVSEGGSLIIQPGVELYFYSGASLIVYGGMTAEGNQTNKIIFDGDDWGSIILDRTRDYPTDSYLSYVEIKNGAGIQCLNGAEVKIQNSLIEDCTQGIYIYNSEPEISNTKIIDPVQNGINADAYGQVIRINDNEIKKSSGHNYQGILLGNNTIKEIFHNDISGFSFGMYCGGGSMAVFGELDGSSYNPNNRILDCIYGIGVGWGAEMYGGLTEEAWGYNSIYDNSVYDIKVYQYSEAYAEDNYWGGEEATYFVDGTSTISVEPYLEEDPWGGESMKMAGGNDLGGTQPGENMLFKGGASFEFLQGLKLEKLGRINEAIELYKGLVSRNTVVEPALSRLLRVAVKHNNTTLIPYLKNIINQSNVIDKAVLLRLSANIKIQEKDMGGAMAAFDEIVALNRGSYEVLSAKFSKLFAVINIMQDPAVASDILSDIKTNTIEEDELKMKLELSEFLLEQLMQNSSRRGLGKKSAEVEILPTEYVLYQNYPNPFNPVTTIKYDLPNESDVELTVYDILGAQVRTLVNEQQEAGYYEVRLNGVSLASGVYLYQLKAGKYVNTKKMILLK